MKFKKIVATLLFSLVTLTNCNSQYGEDGIQLGPYSCKTTYDFVSGVRSRLVRSIEEILSFDGSNFNEGSNSKISNLVDEATSAGIRCLALVSKNKVQDDCGNCLHDLILDLREFKGSVIRSSHQQKPIQSIDIEMLRLKSRDTQDLSQAN